MYSDSSPLFSKPSFLDFLDHSPLQFHAQTKMSNIPMANIA